jgi:hypothetical protein
MRHIPEERLRELVGRIVAADDCRGASVRPVDPGSKEVLYEPQ